MQKTTYQVPRYEGIWPVLVTPFTESLRIDLDAYRQIVSWHMNFALGGLYANCLSSEMYSLSDEEKLQLVEVTVKTVRGQVPVAATGNFGENLQKHIDFCKRVAGAGADVVMLTVPPFISDDEALGHYFLEIAERTEMKLGIYECPQPRAYHLGLPLIKRLAESGRFFAYKETSCNIEKIKQVLEITRQSPLALLQANVPHLLEATKVGVEGSMNIVANWLPDLAVEVRKRGLQGDPSAEELNAILCAMELAQRSIHPFGVKYLMSKRGLPIKPKTRLKRKLSQEEGRCLDIIAQLWFNSDGSLKVLNQMKTEVN